MSTEYTETLVAVIGGVQAVMLALFGLIGKLVVNIRSSSRAVEEQVQNHHDTNLRDDMDAKHEKVTKQLRAIDSRTSKHIELLGERINRVDDRFNGVESRLDMLADLIIADMKRIRE